MFAIEFTREDIVDQIRCTRLAIMSTLQFLNHQEHTLSDEVKKDIEENIQQWWAELRELGEQLEAMP